MERIRGKDFASFNCPEHLIHVQSYQVISSKITQLNATFAGLYLQVMSNLQLSKSESLSKDSYSGERE